MKVVNFFLVIIFIIFLVGCRGKSNFVSKESFTNSSNHTEILTHLDPNNFKQKIDGKEVNFYMLKNNNGIEVTFTNYGQRLLSLIVPDNKGKFEDIVLGFKDLNTYIKAKEKYFGATIGRYGNRIENGNFSLDGKKYQLNRNNGENHLHGGNKGFNDVIWSVNQIAENEIEFFRISPDGEEGYPGNLNVKVHYLLTEANELKIDYEAKTDKKTIINLTHHSFFNLAGEGNGSINNHLLMINADRYTPINENLIPTGELASVSGTPFDFRNIKTIGSDIDNDSEQIKFAKGYDHNFVLNNSIKNKNGLILAAKVKEPTSGRVMEVYTNEPGIQFYGGNFLDGKTVGKSGKFYVYRGAFCLETQHFPDSPNNSSFPNTSLNPGDIYKSTCLYKFYTE